MSPHTHSTVPDICHLRHPSFAALRAPVFRRSSNDGVPVLITSLGEREAALTLPAVQRLLGIVDDSADGRMLASIAQALDYVTELRPGDPLPAEVGSGAASWEVTPAHLRRAILRLRLGLLIGFSERNTAPLDDAALERAVADPALRRQIQGAFASAAHALGLADAEAVIPLLAALAQELAFIEALRERLLSRLQAAVRTIDDASHGWRGDEYHMDMLIQVRRLLAAALTQIAARFAVLAACCEPVIEMLRAIEAHRAMIRSSRDWLYRTQRAFEPILADWDVAPPHINACFWPRVILTYRFLAPRFMVSQKWPHRQRVQSHPPGEFRVTRLA